MSSSKKCKSCGSSDIEVDPGRGDAVCTNCGSVLEVNIIVAEVQFEEGAHGTSSAIGQFVAADSKGGSSKLGPSLYIGSGIESREMTLRKAREGITRLCNQLELDGSKAETACNFFKLALARNLTKGRKNTHVHAACVYLTCRTTEQSHLLIDISDVLQICCYELGRTYLKLSHALSINVPPLDPCLYILRFAAKLEFGAKTHKVANTALRLVQRMKRDSIHLGRRPSGLCGAALLIAARLHDFGRSASDIVKIVKVHESTLRKRLIEFGDTPSSGLTLEEFMTVDLEEEQDPPSFKAARKKDKERLQKLMEEEAESITELQREIEMQLNRDAKVRTRKKKDEKEIQEANRFIEESTLGTINKIIHEENIDDPENIKEPIKELGPDITSMKLANSIDDTSNAMQPSGPLDVDLTFDDIDDEELDSYIMSEREAESKTAIWLNRNAAFLEAQKVKEEKLQKEREEGKPEKKRKRQVRRKPMGPTNSAGEAIEKILQEKKISSKINYDVLKSLNASFAKTDSVADEPKTSLSVPAKRPRLKTEKKDDIVVNPPRDISHPTKDSHVELSFHGQEQENETKDLQPSEEELDEDYEEEIAEETVEKNGFAESLRQHRTADQEEEFYGYDEEEY